MVLILAAILAPHGASGGVHFVAPSVADVAGSNAGVVIHGSNFFQHTLTACRFGGAKVPGEVLDNGRFHCVPPPAPHGGAGFVYVEISMNGQDFQGARDTVAFQYVVPGRMASIYPTSADRGGGATVHVLATSARSGAGGGFTHTSVCTWFVMDARGNRTDETQVGDGSVTRFISSALIQCETPPMDPGDHHVAVANIDAAFRPAKSAAFTAWTPPGGGKEGELSTNGTAGGWRGGTRSTIRWPGDGAADFGSAFGSAAMASCRFGTVVVSATVDPGRVASIEGAARDQGGARDASATCVSPASSPGSIVPLRLAPYGGGSGGISYAASSHTYASLTVDSAVAMGAEENAMSEAVVGAHRAGFVQASSPRGASSAGGSHRFVAMLGADFDPRASACVVSGATSSDAHFVSSAVVLCELPPNAPGAASIATSVGAESSERSRVSIAYAAEGVVSRVTVDWMSVGHDDMDMSAAVGSAAGGDRVRVDGAYFIDGDAGGMRFGTVGPVRARWLTRDALESISPAQRPGTVNVAADSFTSQRSFTSVTFTYVSPGGLRDVAPSLLPVTGEIPMELARWGGLSSLMNLFCTVGANEASRAGCLAPATKPGFAAVMVRGLDPDGQPGTPPIVMVAARPHVAGLSPKTGYRGGGVVAGVFGADFVETEPKCVFGGVGVDAHFVSTAMLLCESPPAASAGAVTVEAGAGDGRVVSQSEMIMTYTLDMRVDSVKPSRGPLEGGNVFVVYGANFVAIEPAACKIGTIGPLAARDNDATGLNATTSLECVAPAADIGTYPVFVGVRTAGYVGGDSSSARYEYENAKHVTAVVPSGGGAGGVTRGLALYGPTIREGSDVDCGVGNVRVAGAATSAGTVSCEDLWVGAFRGFVSVGVNGLRAESLDVVFEFRHPSEVIGAYPRSGYVTGGSVVFFVSRHATDASAIGCAVGHRGGHARLVSSALVACETPVGDATGEFGARLLDGLDDGLDGAYSEIAYHYRVEETALSVEPGDVTAGGGAAVLVAAPAVSTDSRRLACAVGTIAPVHARLLESGLVECVSPAGLDSLRGFAPVRLGLGVEFGRVAANLRVVQDTVPGTQFDDTATAQNDTGAVALAVYTAATPATGAVDGGARVAIFGSNLLTPGLVGVTVRFGKTSVAVVGHFVSSALVLVETPAVDHSGPTCVNDAELVFVFVESARVDSVVPSVTHPSGGSTLVVTGSFSAGSAFNCRVGTIGPIAGSRVDAGTVTCVSPAHDEGVAVVTVSSGLGDTHRRGEAALSYELPRVKKADEETPIAPYVASVVPFAGSLGGGSPVYVSGSELFALVDSFIEFGPGLMAPAHVVSSAVLIVEAPASIDFIGSVAVHGTDGLSGRYTYVEELEDFTVEPTRVGIDGGATITLVGASLGSLGRVSRVACRIGTVGPIAASYAGGHRFECQTPATVRGTRTVAAGTHDGSTWTTGGAVLATHAPLNAFASPPATLGGSHAPHESVLFFSLWLDTQYSRGATQYSLDAGSDSRFVAVRVGTPAVGVNVFVERFAAPKVRSVAPSGGGIEGGSVAFVLGEFDAETTRCVFAARTGGFDVLPASAVGVDAHVVSSALARCETPALADGAAAPMFGYGGGDASLHLQHRGEQAASAAALAWSVARTPWIKETYPSGGSAAGGTVVRVTSAGAVESIQSRKLTKSAGRAGMFGGSGGGGAAVACAFGSLGPVAARGGGAFTDVECVVPAGDPRGSAAGVRIFSQRSVNLPGSPRAPKSGVIGGDFSYTTEGRVEGTLFASDGASDGASIASVLGWGLTPPRGGFVSCVVNGDEPSAALKPFTDSAVACDVPPGPSGFVTLSLSDAVGSVTMTRSQRPTIYAAAPNAVSSAGGGVLSLSGVDVHRAVAFTFGATTEGLGDGDHAVAHHGTWRLVSSALVLVEAPGAAVLGASPDVTTSVTVGAKYGGATGFDASGPSPLTSTAVWLTPTRRIERVAPASGPATGGARTTFALAPKITAVGDAASAECWFGTIGPVRGGEDGSGEIECVSIAHVPGAVATHASARPDARAGGYARRVETSGDTNDDFPTNVYRFFGAQFDRDGLSATVLRSVAVTSRAGQVELAVPHDYDGAVSLDGVNGNLQIYAAGSGGSSAYRLGVGFGTVRIPPTDNPGGFFALSLAVHAAKPFGQVLVSPAPDARSAHPSLQPKDGGGVLWITGSNLGSHRDEFGSSDDSNLFIVAASASASAVSSSVDSPAAVGRIVSSAVVSFESPPMPSGAASLTLATGGVGGVTVPEAAVAAAYLSPAVVTNAEPSFVFSSGAAGSVRVTGAGFRDTGLAACAFGTVGPIAASDVASSGEIACAAPALTPGRSHAIGVSFNRRDYFRRGYEFAANDGVGASLTVARPPVALTAVVPSAVSEPNAAGASLEIVGAGFQSESTVSPCVGAVVPGGVVVGDSSSSYSLTLSPSASTWGIARCTPGALVPATVTAQGFIAVATAAVDIVEGSRAKLYSRDSLVVMVFAAPAIDAISPDIGSAAGGSIVALSGRNLRRGEPGAFTDTYATFGGVAVPLHAVSSAIAYAESPATIGYNSASAEVLAIAGLMDPNAANAGVLAAAGTNSPTHSTRPAMTVREVYPRRAPVTGGSVATLRGFSLGGSSGDSIWCRAGTVGPLAGRRALPFNETTGDADTYRSTNAPASMEVRCVLPAGQRLGAVGVSVSDNRRDWSQTPATIRINRVPTPWNSTDNHTNVSVGSLALAGEPGYLGYDYDLVFSEAVEPIWTFDYVQPATLESVMPPAAVPGGGGIFGASNGIFATFGKTLTPSPASLSAGGVVGCAFGGTSSTRGRRLGTSGDAWLECAPASDPFTEGLFPVIPEGWDSPGTGLALALSNVPVQFEFIQPPQMFAWQPELTHLGGGALVTVVGMNLRVHDQSLVCVFATGPRVGGEISGFAPSVPAASAVSTAVATCEVPSGLPEGVAALSVGTAGSTPAAGGGAAAPLGVAVAPEVTEILPTAGALGGGAAVTLHGKHLRPASGNDELSVRVGTCSPVAMRPGAATGSVEIVAPGRVAGPADVSAGRSISDSKSTLHAAFVYREPFASFHASPVAVAAAGGARVALFGDTGSLPEDGEWTEPSGGRLSLSRVKRNEAAIVAPPMPSGGFHVLTLPDAWEVTSRGVGYRNAVFAPLPQLEHRATASVTAVSPRAAAPGGGGSILDVYGADFHREAVSVRLGEFSSAAPGMPTAQVVSSVLLRVEACGDHHHDTRAPAEVASSVDANADLNAWSSDGVLVAFHRLPSTYRASPASGGEVGGTLVKVVGADFRDAGSKLVCAFGSVTVTAAGFVSMNRVDCVSPAKAPDTSGDPNALAVAVNGRDFSSRIVDAGTFPVTFSYGARAELYGLLPDHGPSLGGTFVTAHGANFLPAAWVTTRADHPFACRFGSKVVPAIVAGSDALTASAATCRSPPHAAGFVAVEISAGGGNFSSFGVAFEYQASAAPEVLFPPVGLASGGTLVTVVGSNFIASQRRVGYGHGMVAQPGSGVLNNGQVGGGGGGGDALSCRFGGVYVSGASAVSSAVLRCETPTFAAAAIDRALAVDASNNGGVDFAQSSTYFEPLGEALVSALEPRAGTVGGGTVVSVYGVGFTADEPVWCRFGTTGPIPAAFLRDGVVRCKSPAKATHRHGVPLEVSRGNTFDVTRDGVLFSI